MKPPHFERAFAYGETVTLVQTRAAETLDWLGEFLGPAFVPSSAAPTRRVFFDAAPGAYTVWRDSARPQSEPIECFTLDSGADLWAAARSDDAGIWAYDDEARVALRADRGSDAQLRVSIVSERERPLGRAALMRAVRELASSGAAGRGELSLHASAVETADGVTLFIGRKRAGKSTLQLYVLTTGAARFVSNDRVFAVPGGSQPVARAMPSIVSLREGTLALHPPLDSAVRSGAWHFPNSVADGQVCAASGTRAPTLGTRPVPGLSPAQFCSLLEVEAVAGGPLARIVFPTIDENRVGAAAFELSPLDGDRAAARLLETGLLANGRCSPWLAPETLPQRAALEAAVASLARNVPCLALTIGPHAYATPALWKAIENSAAAR